MILRQTLDHPIAGYWDGGAKDRFDWCIESWSIGSDKAGQFVRVGSWEANHYFTVALGKTDKLTLANAKRHLSAMAIRKGINCTFKYIG